MGGYSQRFYNGSARPASQGQRWTSFLRFDLRLFADSGFRPLRNDNSASKPPESIDFEESLFRLGSVDSYLIHRTIAAIVTTARKFSAVFSKRVATLRNCLSLEKQHSIRWRWA